LAVGLTRERLLLRCRFRGNSIGPTVKAGASIVDDCRVIDDRCVHIRRANHRCVYVYRRCVVREDAPAPLTAGESASAITESIVDATVEADLCPPISGVEDIHAAVSPAPVSRCPEIAGLGREDPRTRDPIVVAEAVPCPVARCPHVVGLRTGRLDVYGDCWRLDIDADAN